MRLPWDNQKVTESTEVEEVARIFIELLATGWDAYYVRVYKYLREK